MVVVVVISTPKLDDLIPLLAALSVASFVLEQDRIAPRSISPNANKRDQDSKQNDSVKADSYL